MRLLRPVKTGVTFVCMGVALSGCVRKTSKTGVISVETRSESAATMKAEEHASGFEMSGWGENAWQAIEGAEDVGWDAGTGVLQIGFGNDLNGVRWGGALPGKSYVLELEARRISGSDFFCGLTFPVRNAQSSVSLIVGGWGGSLVGISSIDGMDASENSTASQHEFEDGRWYRIRVQVGDERIRAWIDGKEVVDAHTEGQRLSLRPGPIESCAPLGLATWQTKAEIRGIRWREAGD